MNKKICDLENCGFQRAVGDVVLARGEKMFLWSVSKGRKVYTFQTQVNNSRIISKDATYLVDQVDDRLVIMKRNAGGNYKLHMIVTSVASFSIENSCRYLSVSTARNFLVYDLEEKAVVFTGRLGYSCWSHVSHSRNFVLRQVYMESELFINRMDGKESNRDQSQWLSCDFVDFIGSSDEFYYVTRGGAFRRFNCNTNQDVCLLKEDAQYFEQSPSSRFTAVKVGYYTNANQPQHVQFFKDGQPWSIFNQMPDVDGFLTENLLFAIVERHYSVDEQISAEYPTVYTGILYETNDEWQTCKEVARFKDCEKFFLNAEGEVCAIFNRDKYSTDAISIEKISW